MAEDTLTPDQKADEKLTPAAKAADETERTNRRRERLQQRTFLSDCSLMLRYALDESCQIPLELMQNIAKIDALLIAAGKDPLSDIPKELQKLQAKPGGPTESIDDILLRVHNALSDLVAPATALSLRETDPELKWFGMPRIVQWAIGGALLFMI